MKKPRLIHFKDDSLMILKSSLLAASPEEGCALLIGQQQQAHPLKPSIQTSICMIWPCMNVWETNALNFPESTLRDQIKSQSNHSKANRFAIDPREQLNAQRWARAHEFLILGNAHSHPKGDAVPSLIDKSWTFSSGIMAIMSERGIIRTWWMENSPNFQPQELAYFNE